MKKIIPLYKCIECRVATLNLDRDYVDFVNAVYHYASLFFAAPETITAEEIENRKKDMWEFAWRNQWLYLQLLKTRAQRQRAMPLALEVNRSIKKDIVNPKGEGTFFYCKKRV